jgi:hypothetical protein
MVTRTRSHRRFRWCGGSCKEYVDGTRAVSLVGGPRNRRLCIETSGAPLRTLRLFAMVIDAPEALQEEPDADVLL